MTLEVNKKLTSKQEGFCQAVVSGLSQADAYRKVYNAASMTAKTLHKRATELMKNGAMTGRIAGLRKPVVEKLQYDLEKAMLEAAEAFNVSKSKENGGAMVAAVTLRAKLNGLLIERKEIKLTTVEQLADADLNDLIIRKAREAGVVLH